MAGRDINGMLASPVWNQKSLEADRRVAIDYFIHERMEEPLEAYISAYDKNRPKVEALLDGSLDLKVLGQNAHAVLADMDILRAFRYLPGPPVSEDDLKTLIGVNSLNLRLIRNDAEIMKRIITTIMEGLDQKRFPWVIENREPLPEERYAAIVATTALMATQQVATARRNEGKKVQETRVREALLTLGLRSVASRKITNLRDAPAKGEFCGQECLLGGSKADMVVALWDNRTMPIECKVSNSSINSFKRLYHEASGKAISWTKEFGSAQVVPAAVLSGVYSLSNLESAQNRGLSIFWAHRLSDLTEWIASTHPF